MDELELETCTLCGGPLALLGQLGNLTWCRCINCGMDQSTEAANDDN